MESEKSIGTVDKKMSPSVKGNKVPLEKGDSPLSQAYGLPAPLLGEPIFTSSVQGTPYGCLFKGELLERLF